MHTNISLPDVTQGETYSTLHTPPCTLPTTVLLHPLLAICSLASRYTHRDPSMHTAQTQYIDIKSRCYVGLRQIYERRKLFDFKIVNNLEKCKQAY